MFCTQCGAASAGEAKFCMACGISLTGEPNFSTAPDAEIPHPESAHARIAPTSPTTVSMRSSVLRCLRCWNGGVDTELPSYHGQCPRCGMVHTWKGRLGEQASHIGVPPTVMLTAGILLCLALCAAGGEAIYTSTFVQSYVQQPHTAANVSASADGAAAAGAGAQLSTSDAKYAITRWDTGNVSEKWEVSNGFLLTEYRKGVMSSYKMPYANCFGFEEPALGDHMHTEQHLMCQMVKDSMVDGCTYENAPTQYPLKRGDLFAAEFNDGRYCGAWIYHLKRS